jgi:hypothetical protein
MDEIWWQKLLCEFHVVRKHTVVGRREGSEEGWDASDAERVESR